MLPHCKLDEIIQRPFRGLLAKSLSGATAPLVKIPVPEFP